MALTAGNAFFVAAEFSLVTVDRAALDRLVDEGDAGARTVRMAVRELSFQLSGAQLGITISALLAGYLAEPALASLLHAPLDLLGGARDGVAKVLALVIATLLSMLFGELVPKSVAIARPLPTARLTAGGMRIFSGLFGWVIRFLNGTANVLVRRLGVEPQEELASARSPEELGMLAAYSATAGALPVETALLLRRTIRFGEKRAAEAMTPRVDVIGVAAAESVQSVIALIRQTGKSRFPVYEQSLDHVVGVITVIEALGVPPARRATTAVRTVAREAVLVPESLDLDGVLATLQAASQDIAIVVDEYGGTDGVVTLEDLVEELVGEIADEFDIPALPTLVPDQAAGIGDPGAPPGPGRAPAVTAEPGRAPAVTVASDERSWVVDGMLRADELEELTGFRLPEGPYETLAGLLLSLLGHIPAAGETVLDGGWEFTVIEVERRRIEHVRVVAPIARAEAGGAAPRREADRA